MALKKENPNSSNYDIRKIVTKDCIKIWQKATMREANIIVSHSNNIQEI
jgi:hypothetical protein